MAFLKWKLPSNTKLKNFFKIILKYLILISLVISILFVGRFLYRSAVLAYLALKKSFISQSLVFEYKNFEGIRRSENLYGWLEDKKKAFDSYWTCPESFYKDLKKNFKFIKKIEWDFSSPIMSKLRIISLKPSFIINDSFILGDSRRLLDAELFSSDYINSYLKKIYMHLSHSQIRIDSEIYEFLRQIPNTIFDDYVLYYKDKNYIFLKSKSSKHALVADTQTIFDSKKFLFISTVLEDFSKNERLKKGLKSKNSILTLDFRFKDRIVVKFSENFM